MPKRKPVVPDESDIPAFGKTSPPIVTPQGPFSPYDPLLPLESFSPYRFSPELDPRLGQPIEGINIYGSSDLDDQDILSDIPYPPIGIEEANFRESSEFKRALCERRCKSRPL